MRMNRVKKLTSILILVSMAMLFILPTAFSERPPWDCPECGSTGNTGNFCGNCSHPAPSSDKKVGIAFPNINLQRWLNGGNNLKTQLESYGYTVLLQYCDNNAKKQKKQIQSMIDQECDILIVACVDSSSLSSVLKKARKKGIPVIAYDHLIFDSKAISYYIAFDSTSIGELQGKYIVDKLNLEEKEGPFHIEITMGDLDDNINSKFYQGAMSVIQPYIDSGKLIVKSGQTSLEEVSALGWRSDYAQARADAIIYQFYSDETNLDAWLCANDSVAIGVISALEESYNGKWPIVTGQDCDLPNIIKILAGKQSMSVFTDTNILATSTIKLINQIFAGDSIKTNGAENNGAKKVPALFCDPVVVDKSNYEKILIDSGYYTKDQLQ